VPTTETYQHTTVSLDGLLLNSTSLPVYTIRIDTDGYKMAVLTSLEGTLTARRVRHIIIEVTPPPLLGTQQHASHGELHLLPLLGYGRVLDVVASSRRCWID
jgi:hypothetical protein